MQLFLGLLALWVVFVSGIFSEQTGTPGIAQALKLDRLLNEKTLILAQHERETASLQEEREKLIHDPLTQEREIRRVLGYVAPRELIFEFK